ncbi:hypothetical protein BESB_004090 [Besnoitia besnoiti]|uniref:Uncharacterized protein n=1 Tax=Besnoitia besnoiti TaxID=94643 RepID=A0A2A9MHQ1_BESBE|nr:hypothetical protein BESB_004090 [Besnoitia besnoiti]PFH38068.1 hypothetical protein BESB_004090 [Besnoitia besnoiti]
MIRESVPSRYGMKAKFFTRTILATVSDSQSRCSSTCVPGKSATPRTPGHPKHIVRLTQRKRSTSGFRNPVCTFQSSVHGLGIECNCAVALLRHA